MFKSGPLGADVNINDGGSAFLLIFWTSGGSSHSNQTVLSWKPPRSLSLHASRRREDLIAAARLEDAKAPLEVRFSPGRLCV